MLCSLFVLLYIFTYAEHSFTYGARSQLQNKRRKDLLEKYINDEDFNPTCAKNDNDKLTSQILTNNIPLDNQNQDLTNKLQKRNQDLPCEKKVDSISSSTKIIEKEIQKTNKGNKDSNLNEDFTFASKNDEDLMKDNKNWNLEKESLESAIEVLKEDTLNLKEENKPQLEENITQYRRIKLPTFENVKINKEIEVELPGELDARMKVLSLNPLIFEIDNFLDEEESDLFIDIAKSKPMKTLTNKVANMEFKNAEQTFKEWDYNQDGIVTTDEVIILPGLADIKFTEQDADDMFFMLKMDKNKDGVIELQEMKDTDFTKANKYFTSLKSDVARQRNVTSRGNWVWHDTDGLLKYNKDGYYEEFHERISAVTGIPVEIIEESEPIQVKQFSKHQFQMLRQDSEPYNRDAPCCLYGDINKVCRLCRYISYTIFLNDVDDGGELIFPLANHKYQDVMNNSGEWRGYYIYTQTTGNRFYFKADMTFLRDGANHVVTGEGADESGGFIFHNSIIIGDTIKFEKKYKDESNGEVLIKCHGKVIEGTKISGNWWISGQKRMRGTFFMWNRDYEIFSARAIDESNQIDGCSLNTSLNIKPKKGKAIFWYNHHTNPRDGMIGDINQEAMTAHCEVKKGEKWIASSWINIIGDGDLELRAWRRGDNWLTYKQKLQTKNIYQMLGTNELKLQNEPYESEYIAEQLGKNRTEFDDTMHDGYYQYKPASNALQALNLLFNDLNSDQLRLIARTVHKKLGMQCIPLTVEHQGKVSIVDGSVA